MVPVVLAVMVAGCSGGGADDRLMPERGGEGLPAVAPDLDEGPAPQGSVTRVYGRGRASPPGGRVFSDIAASWRRTCGVRESGELECWGDPWRWDGVEVLPSGRFVKVSLSTGLGCAISEDGSLACWLGADAVPGTAYSGAEVRHELTASWLDVPQGRFVDVSAATLCAVRADGRLVCWGEDDYNRVDLPEGRFVELVEGRLCALAADGRLSCWGDYLANYGRSRMPRGRFVDISAAGPVQCAVRVEGPLVCWQHEHTSQYGAHRVLELVGERAGSFTEVVMGREHVCALTEAGSLECWGRNDDGLAQSRPGPFAQVAASQSEYCALDPAGRASCWGYRVDSDDTGEWDTPDGVFTQVSVRVGLACGVRADATVQCWGDVWEHFDRLGRMERELSRLTDSCTVRRIVATCDEYWEHLHEYGDFGIGRYRLPRHWPGWLHNSALRWVEHLPPARDGYASIHLEHPRACGRRIDGSVWCLDGDGGTESAAVGQSLRFETVNAYGCGVSVEGEYRCATNDDALDDWLPHRDFVKVTDSCGLRSDGRLECFGFRDTVQPLEGVEPLVSAAALDRSAICGVHADGSLACWYDHPDHPQAGEQIDPGRPTTDAVGGEAVGDGRVQPTRVEGAFARVYSGSGGMCALSTTGEASCWWHHRVDPFYRPPGEPPEGPFADIAVGPHYACATRTDGTVACWGEDHYEETDDNPPRWD